MGFGSQAYAQQFRDLITSIARKVVSEERPEPRIGKVYSYDAGNGVAYVLFAGDTVENVVKVRVAKNMEPQVTMEASFSVLGYDAPADIVRVWGKPGSYFLLDYYSGAPAATPMIGVPLPWLTSTPPAKCVLLGGQVESRTEYPKLFELWGTAFNTGGEAVTEFRVPDGKGKMLIGADGTITVGSSGGSKTKSIAAANLPAHSHTINHQHTQILTSTTGSNLDFASGGTAGVQAGATGGVRAGGGTLLATNTFAGSSGSGPGSGSPLDVLNPYLGVNWIVRAAV